MALSLSLSLIGKVQKNLTVGIPLLVDKDPGFRFTAENTVGITVGIPLLLDKDPSFAPQQKIK